MEEAPLARDADTGRIVASAPTHEDADDGSQVGPSLDRIGGPVASLTGDGGFDGDDVHAEVAARHPAAGVTVPPCSGAIPSEATDAAGPHYEARPSGWQRALGHNPRAPVEAHVSRLVRVTGDGLHSPTDGRRTAEVAIAAGVPNRMLELGRRSTSASRGLG